MKEEPAVVLAIVAGAMLTAGWMISICVLLWKILKALRPGEAEGKVARPRPTAQAPVAESQARKTIFDPGTYSR